MVKTIKGKLTISVICIVAVSIVLTTAGIVMVAGRRLIKDQTEALQLNADKYAEEINTWIENEKMLAKGAANGIEAAGNIPDEPSCIECVHRSGEGRGGRERFCSRCR